MHEGLLRGDRPLQHRDVPAHRPRSDPSRQRQQQPADPLCRQPRLLAQPPDDLLPPRVQIADPRRRHPHRRRRPPHGPADRLDVQLQPPGDFLLRHLLHQMQVANLGPLRHPDHLRVLLAVSTRRPCLAPSIIARRPLSFECSGGPFSSGHGVPFRNGYRSRVWKHELQHLADETGLTIQVSHFPPGTSKWNKIEHRLFCHITANWRGTPLTTYETVVDRIGNTRTAAGASGPSRTRCR